MAGGPPNSCAPSSTVVNTTMGSIDCVGLQETTLMLLVFCPIGDLDTVSSNIRPPMIIQAVLINPTPDVNS